MYELGKTTTLWNYLLLAGQRRTSGTLYKGALRMWLRLSVCNRQGLAVLVLSLALIHQSAWKVNSQKVVCRLLHSPASWSPYGQPEIFRLLKVNHYMLHVLLHVRIKMRSCGCVASSQNTDTDTGVGVVRC